MDPILNVCGVGAECPHLQDQRHLPLSQTRQQARGIHPNAVSMLGQRQSGRPFINPYTANRAYGHASSVLSAG